MKSFCTLFAFLLLAAFTRAATNTLYTTTTNKVLAVTATGKSVIEATNAAAARTALSITNATGLEATAANLTTVSNSVTTLQNQLPGYATNLGALATNFTAYGLTINTGSTNNSLTASRAVVTDANKGIVSSAVTSTELGYVSGVTSAIQTQFDAKATAANLTTVSNSVTGHGNALATNTALLNGTNVLTGTNNFTGTVLITNASSTISGNGAGLTNLAAGSIASGTLDNARTTAASANTASAIVARDSSGNFSAGTISANAAKLGTTTALGVLHSSTTSAVENMIAANYQGNANGARFNFYKSRGTEASPTVLSNGDIIGSLRWSGYDGGAYLLTGKIDVFNSTSDGNPASGSIPGTMAFYINTPGSGASTLTEVARFTASKGNLSIGTTANQLSGATKELMVSAGTSGDATCGLTLQGSRSGAGSAASFITFYNRGNAAAGIVAVTDSATDGYALQFKTSVSGAGGSSTEYFRILADGTLAGGASSGLTPANVGLIIYNKAAADVGLKVQGASSQSGALQQWQNSSGTALLKVDANGVIVLPTNTAAPSTITGSGQIYSLQTAGTAEIYVKDGAGNATQISPHARGSLPPEGRSIDDGSHAFPIIVHHANVYAGEEEWVNLTALAAAVEKLTGQKLTYKRKLAPGLVADWEADQDRQQAEHFTERQRELASLQKWQADTSEGKSANPPSVRGPFVRLARPKHVSAK